MEPFTEPLTEPTADIAGDITRSGPNVGRRWGGQGLPDEHRPCRLVLGTCMRGPVGVTDRLGTTGPGRTLSRPGRRWCRATLVRSPVH